MTGPPAGRTAFAAALALLTGRALTAAELAERLNRRGFDADAIAAALARLAGLGYLDDRRTAAAWAESAVRVRGWGPRRLQDGLVRRGLPHDVVEEVVASLFAARDETLVAIEALGRWERTRGRPTDAAGRQAAYAYLRRRGFSGAAARAALFKSPEIE